MCIKKLDAENYFLTKWKENQFFSEILLNPAIVCIYVTDLLSLCMKKFDTEKVFFFLQYDTVFNGAIFWRMQFVRSSFVEKFCE